MSSHKKPVPEFQNEDEERAFWASHDSTEYLAWEEAQRVRFPALKPSTRSISLRLPQSMLDEVKSLAHERDVPYQSLIKMFLRERLDEEYRRRKARMAE